MTTVDQMIQRHESLWTNGQLVRTRHTKWELYELVDSTNSKNRCYVTKGYNGGWATCGKPRGNSLGVFGHATPLLTFEDLRAKEIANFPARREFMKDRIRVVSLSTNLIEAA